MSHVVTIQSVIRDPAAIAAACKRLALAAPWHGEHKLFDGTICKGYAVQLPDWLYPVVYDVSTGKAHFDNYKGRWGDSQHLNRFTQAYTVERALIEARRKGYRTTETTLPDGSIRLAIAVNA